MKNTKEENILARKNRIKEYQHREVREFKSLPDGEYRMYGYKVRIPNKSSGIKDSVLGIIREVESYVATVDFISEGIAKLDKCDKNYYKEIYNLYVNYCRLYNSAVIRIDNRCDDVIAQLSKTNHVFHREEKIVLSGTFEDGYYIEGEQGLDLEERIGAVFDPYLYPSNWSEKQQAKYPNQTQAQKLSRIVKRRKDKLFAEALQEFNWAGLLLVLMSQVSVREDVLEIYPEHAVYPFRDTVIEAKKVKEADFNNLIQLVSPPLLFSMRELRKRSLDRLYAMYETLYSYVEELTVFNLPPKTNFKNFTYEDFEPTMKKLFNCYIKGVAAQIGAILCVYYIGKGLDIFDRGTREISIAEDSIGYVKGQYQYILAKMEDFEEWFRLNHPYVEEYSTFYISGCSREKYIEDRLVVDGLSEHATQQKVTELRQAYGEAYDIAKEFFLHENLNKIRVEHANKVIKAQHVPYTHKKENKFPLRKTEPVDTTLHDTFGGRSYTNAYTFHWVSSRNLK